MRISQRTALFLLGLTIAGLVLFAAYAPRRDADTRALMIGGVINLGERTEKRATPDFCTELRRTNPRHFDPNVCP